MKQAEIIEKLRDFLSHLDKAPDPEFRKFTIRKKDKIKTIYAPQNKEVYELINYMLKMCIKIDYIINDYVFVGLPSVAAHLHTINTLIKEKKRKPFGQIPAIKLDIVDYFESVSVKRVLSTIANSAYYIETLADPIGEPPYIRIYEPSIKEELFVSLDIVKKAITKYCVVDNKIPIGLPTSPLLAYFHAPNLINTLSSLASKYEHQLHIIRYADDILLLLRGKVDISTILRAVDKTMRGYGFKYRYEIIEKKQKFEFLGLALEIHDDHIKMGWTAKKARRAITCLQKEVDKRKEVRSGIIGYFGSIAPFIKYPINKKTEKILELLKESNIECKTDIYLISPASFYKAAGKRVNEAIKLIRKYGFKILTIKQHITNEEVRYLENKGAIIVRIGPTRALQQQPTHGLTGYPVIIATYKNRPFIFRIID